MHPTHLSPMRRSLRGALGVVLAGTLTFAGAPIPARAAESASVDKAETVYVYTTATGAVREVTVHDVLANGSASDSLRDVSTLTGITSDSEFSPNPNSGELSWTAAGKEVEYRGTSSNQPPVLMHVSCTLDGEPIAPADLAGKSGHVTMRFDFENTSWQNRIVAGQIERICTPFVAVTSVSLSRDVFENISVTNGKVTDGSGSVMVIGYALPGLAESLSLSADDVDIPTHFEISADATDFELGSATTIVTAELLSDMDLDADTGELGDSVHTLSDAMATLSSGASELEGALGQIAQAQEQLASGIGEFRDKTGALPDATKQLAQGASQLSEGIGTATQGAHDLATYASDLPGLTKQLGEATASARAVATATDEGLASVAQGLEALQGEVERVATADAEALAAAQDAASIASASAGQLDATVTAAQAASEALGALDLSQLDEAQAQAVTEAIAALDALAATDAQATATALGEAASTLAEAQTADTTALAQGLAGAVEGVGSSRQGVAGVDSYLDGIAKGLEGAQQLAQALSEGASSLASGLNGAGEGAQGLATGVSQLDASMPGVVAGADALKSGASQLAEATRAAASGSSALSSGIVQMNDQGIQKLVDTFDTDIAGMGDRLDALCAAADAYDTFAGKAEGATGSVTFVYKMDAIEP